MCMTICWQTIMWYCNLVYYHQLSTVVYFQSTNREVVDFLQYMCSNDIDIDVGSIVHTGMQNERGGHENDCTIARLDKSRFVAISVWVCFRAFITFPRHIDRDQIYSLGFAYVKPMYF